MEDYNKTCANIANCLMINTILNRIQKKRNII